MSCAFYNFEYKDFPLKDGQEISTESELHRILEECKKKVPHAIQLVAPSGAKLLIGISNNLSMVQYTAPDGNPPYLVARGEGDPTEECMEFLCGNTPTPIKLHLCIPYSQLLPIALHFLSTGKSLGSIAWEEV